MAQCFCGCGRKARFGIRSVNKRGTMIRGDVRLVEDLLRRGVVSPNGERFVHDGLLFCEALAEAVHAGIDPGPEVEQETRGFMAFARQHFGQAALGRSLRTAGMSVEEAVVALNAGQFDPFAEVDYPLKSAEHG